MTKVTKSSRATTGGKKLSRRVAWELFLALLEKNEARRMREVPPSTIETMTLGRVFDIEDTR